MPELRLENSVVDDRYLVDRCLGRGSYAEIFLALDQQNNDRLVIIKALNTSLQGTPDPDLEQTLVENFQNEAIALDRVRHPHIIQRLGHGTAADLEGVPFHYLVLEYMQGGDLWALCRQRALCLDDVLLYFQQVAEALAYAHSQRVIHRDIKPNNLLLSADRRELKIADFGVAKMAHDDASEITRVGTNVYAPPEHHPDVRQDDLNEKLTPSADVYSLAKTIYTAMTGRAPRQFSREAIKELPSELARETWAAQLLEVLCKATSSRVADRYQSVEAFWEHLVRVRSIDAASQEIDDEATIVRSRLNTTSTVGQVAALPDFHTLANVPREVIRSQKARIVVELPSHNERRSADEQSYVTAEEPGSRAARQPSDTGVEEPAGVATQALGSTANGARVQSLDRNANVTVATDEKQAAALRARRADTRVVRGERGLLERIRSVVTSEWLRRVFIIFLLAALIGLAASMYYHFAGKPIDFPLFGSAAKDGRIANAPKVNLRSDPSGSVLVELPEGTRVRVVEERGAWVRIRILDWVGTAPADAPDSGWVGVRYVKTD